MAVPEYLNQNAAELVRLIKDGAIFIRPEGATAPTGTEWVPGAADSHVGYYSEDGYTLSPNAGDATEFVGHNGDPVISEQAPGYWTTAFSGLEGGEAITCAYFDIKPEALGADGSITVVSAANTMRYDLVLVGLDQKDRLILVHFPSVQISEKEELTFNRSTLLAYGLTFRTFKGGSAAPYHFKAWGFINEEADAGGE